MEAAARLDEALSQPRCTSSALKTALAKAEAAAAAAAPGACLFVMGAELLQPRISAAKQKLEVERAAEGLARAASSCKAVADLPRLEAAILAARKVRWGRGARERRSPCSSSEACGAGPPALGRVLGEAAWYRCASTAGGLHVRAAAVGGRPLRTPGGVHATRACQVGSRWRRRLPFCDRLCPPACLQVGAQELDQEAYK